MKPITDFFSVIIVNYNGFDYVSACVKSILESEYQKIEIIVVDNASTDNSHEKLHRKFGDKVMVVSLEKNYGPSRARNEGAKVAKGEFLAFLDNDTEVHPDWIIEGKRVFDNIPEAGILQCKLVLYNDRQRLDYAGEWLGPNGFLVHVAKAGEMDHGQFDGVREILAAKSAGMFIRRATFDATNGFDPDYFIMVEETDLGWRAWLAGYKTYLAPKAVVYHHYSTSWSILGPSKALRNARYHGAKNYLMTIIKNTGTRNLCIMLPKNLIIWMGFSFFRLLSGSPQEFGYIWKAIFWNITYLPKNLTKRKAIQSSRTIDDETLFAAVLRRQSLISKIIDCAPSFNAINKLSSFWKGGHNEK